MSSVSYTHLDVYKRQTPFLAIDEQHIGALGLGDLNALEMLSDIIAGPTDVAVDDLAKLIDPLIALVLIGADQRIHGKNIQGVVVAEGGFLVHTILQGLVVDDMVAADQTGQVKGFGRCIESDRAVSCILADEMCIRDRNCVYDDEI